MSSQASEVAGYGGQTRLPGMNTEAGYAHRLSKVTCA